MTKTIFEIEQAKETMDWADDEFLPREAQLWFFAKATAYAAIAQAEQSKRIADMMESYLAIYGDPAVLNNLNQ